MKEYRENEKEEAAAAGVTVQELRRRKAERREAMASTPGVPREPSPGEVPKFTSGTGVELMKDTLMKRKEEAILHKRTQIYNESLEQENANLRSCVERTRAELEEAREKLAKAEEALAEKSEEGLGTCIGVFTAREAERRWRELIDAAGENDIFLTVYTFDLESITEALVKQRTVHPESSIKLVADKGQGMGHSTRAMHQQLLKLQEAGVQVRLLSGNWLAKHYGVSAPRLHGRTGIQHSKTLRVGDRWMVGSCNWTWSSMANWEVVTEVKLNAAGAASLDLLYGEFWGIGVALDAVIEAAESRRKPRIRESSQSNGEEIYEVERRSSEEEGRGRWSQSHDR